MATPEAPSNSRTPGSKTKSPELSTAKPSSKPTEEVHNDLENSKAPLRRALRLANKTRTWSAAELLSSDSEASDVIDNPCQPSVKGTAKESPQPSTSEASVQASSSNKQPAQSSKKNVRKSGGSKLVGQSTKKQRPRKNSLQRKDSCGKASVSHAKPMDAAISLDRAPAVKEAGGMENELVNRNAKMPPLLYLNEPVRQPMIKEKDSPYKCSVQGCPSSGDKCFIGLWLFALPSAESSAPMHSAWLNSVPIDPEINRPRSPRICFQHFVKEDFVSTKKRLVGLSENAVPSIHIPIGAGKKVKSYNCLTKQPNDTIGTGEATGHGSLNKVAKPKTTGSDKVIMKPAGKPKSKAGVSKKVASTTGKRSQVKHTEAGATAQNTPGTADKSVVIGSNETDSQVGSAGVNAVTKPAVIHVAKTALTNQSGLVRKQKSKSVGDSRMISTTGSTSKAKRKFKFMHERKADKMSAPSETGIHPLPAVASKTDTTGETSSQSTSHPKYATTAALPGRSSNGAYHPKSPFHKEIGRASGNFSKLMDRSISVFAATGSGPGYLDSASQLRPATLRKSASMSNSSKPATTALLNSGMVTTLAKDLCTLELDAVNKPLIESSGDKPTDGHPSNTSDLLTVVKQEVEEAELLPADLDASITLSTSSESLKSCVEQRDYTFECSDLNLLPRSNLLASASLPAPLCLPPTNESSNTEAVSRCQNRASRNSIGTTGLTHASFENDGSAESSHVVKRWWDCSQGAALSLNCGEVYENAFRAVGTKSDSSQTLGRAAKSLSATLHASSGQKRKMADCHSANDSKAGAGSEANFGLCSPGSNLRCATGIGQECGTMAYEPEVSAQRALVPYRPPDLGQHVSRLESGSACRSSSELSNAHDRNDSGQQGGACQEEWVPFHPSHGRYIIEKEYLEGEDLGTSVYCRLTWVAIAGNNGEISRGPQTSGCRQANWL